LSVPLPSAPELVGSLLGNGPRLDLAALGGLSPEDVTAIARLGAAALTGNRPADAATIFGALEALEPHNAQHSLHRAYAEEAAGRRAEAVAASTRFLDANEGSASHADTVRALLLRARQRDPADQRLVQSDLAAAEFLATRDDEARAVLEAGR
jgi:hypothetical protein